MRFSRWSELARRFGLAGVTAEPVRVARGAMGEVWQLTTGTGSWAVKWQFPWAPDDPRPADVAVQLAAAAAGIPLPRPVSAPDGTVVVRIEGQCCRVYEWADLGPALPVPVAPPRAAEAGGLLGRLHTLALPPAGQDDPWYREIPAPADWAALTTEAAVAGVPWAAGLAAANGLIGRLSDAAGPAPAGPRITCHRDFTPDNIWPAAPDGRLAVLDWENCGPMPAGQELGQALYCFAGGPAGLDLPSARAFLAGYREAAGALPDPGPQLFCAAIAIHLNLLLAMARQALDEPVHREHAERRIAELLGGELSGLLGTVRMTAGERILP